MLSNQICSGCSRQVRLTTAIQSPRCPAYRFSLLPPIPETRSCLHCHIPIPADSPTIRCVCCKATRYPEPCYTPCYDYQVPFLVRLEVMQYPSCRLRRLNMVQHPSDFRQTTDVSFNPTLNSFQSISAPIQTPQPKRRKYLPPAPIIERQPSVLNRTVAFLFQKHESRMTASDLFPPDVSTSLVRRSIARFEKEIGIASRDIAYYSYSMLTSFANAHQILDKNPVLQLLEGFLDLCGYTNSFWNLYLGYNTALLHGSAPKFSTVNKVNVTLYQNYPEAFIDLTLTKEYLITKSYSIEVVLKLHPSS